MIVAAACARRPACGQPLADQPIVFESGWPSFLRAKVMIAAVDRDDGLTGALCLRYLGKRLHCSA